MPWTNPPNPPNPTQLTIGSGPPVPGSGVTVIGGALPPEMVAAGYTYPGSSIIWYSTGATYRYWYLLQSDTYVLTGQVEIGYVDNAGVLHPVFDLDDGLLSIQSPGPNSKIILSAAPGAEIYSSVNVNTGYTTVAGDTTGIDSWSAPYPSGPAATRGGTYTATAVYFISYDRMVTVCGTITFSAPPTSAGGIVCTQFIPASLVPSGPAGLVLYGAGRNTITGALVVANISAGSRDISLGAVDTGLSTYRFTMTYPIAKPTF